MVGAAILAVFVLLAIFGPLLVHKPLDGTFGMPNEAPSAAHPFGTTADGQDVLVETILGARVSLAVGFGSALSVMAIGAAVGMIGGYFGGWIDAALSLFTNVFLIMPGLPLAVILAAYLPAGPLTIALLLVITGWSWNARVLRAQVLTLREKDFVAAAVVSGESSFRIIFREILPNMTSLLMSGFISATVYAIGAEVGLEFLGLGDISVASWGTNLYWAANNSALITGAYWTVLPTGVSIALVGFALVMINFALDEITNPRLHAERLRASLAKEHGFEAAFSTPVVRSDRRG